MLEPLQQQQQVLQPPLGAPSWFPINAEGWVWEPLARDEGVSELSIMYHETLRLWVKVRSSITQPCSTTSVDPHTHTHFHLCHPSLSFSCACAHPLPSRLVCPSR